LGDSIFTLIAGIAGVAVGFILSKVSDYWSLNGSRKKYGTVFYFELEELKRELDKIIQDYDLLNKITRNELGLPKDLLQYSPGKDPEKFLLRWDFKSKYIFLQKNFEKLSLFKPEVIKSIIKINSLLEEFEEYKQISIKNYETKELEKIGMFTAEQLLINNLKKAQEEISNTLQYLKNEIA